MRKFNVAYLQSRAALKRTHINKRKPRKEMCRQNKGTHHGTTTKNQKCGVVALHI